MNSKQKKLNESLKVMDKSFHYREGIIKFSKYESFEHFLAKCFICYELKQCDHDFYTEAIFQKGLRADIFVPAWNEAIEVVNVEPEMSMKKKDRGYPVSVRFHLAKEIIKINLERMGFRK